MPRYRQDVDLNQKRLVTVSMATTFFKRSFAGKFIIVEWFHSENVVEIMNSVHELEAYKICPDIVTMLI